MEVERMGRRQVQGENGTHAQRAFILSFDAFMALLFTLAILALVWNYGGSGRAGAAGSVDEEGLNSMVLEMQAHDVGWVGGRNEMDDEMRVWLADGLERCLRFSNMGEEGGAKNYGKACEEKSGGNVFSVQIPQLEESGEGTTGMHIVRRIALTKH